MQTDTADHIKQLLLLQAKDENELRAICEGLRLDVEGSKPDLIDKILTTKLHIQFNVTQAQAIPLRTRDNAGNPIPGVAQAIQKWRRTIFQAKNNEKEFELLNGNGKPYKIKMRYIRCSLNTMQSILAMQWYLPLPQHRDLINMMQTEGDKYTYSIIQKPDKSGNSWLMLHCEPKV